MEFTANKFWIALGAGAGVLATALADGKLDGSELGGVIIAFVGALFVYVTPNRPK